jgi:tight adherence protein B
VSPAILAIIITLIFVGMLLAGSFVYWGVASKREARARSLARRLGTIADPDDTANLFQIKQVEPLVESLGFVGRYLENLVRQAGVPYPASGLASRIGLFALAGALVLGTLFSFRAGMAGLLFGIIPWLRIRSKAAQRTVQLSEQLPDSLDLVGRSLQAGHGIADAMRLCAEEMPLPIAREFGQVYEEHNLGRDFRECMVELAERNPHNFDVRIFVSSTLLQRETGGNLIEILDNIAATVRSRFIFKGKVRALTAEARMSAFILGALPFVVTGALLVLRPDYLNPLFTESLGRSMLMVCALLFSSGILLMRGLAQVEV